MEEAEAPRPRVQRLASVKNRVGKFRQAPSRPGSKPKPKPTCPECSSTNIANEDGTTVCLECGTTISDTAIVNEVTFGESTAGAAIVQGGFVGEGQRHARTAGARGLHEQRESREVSEQNGRDEMRKQANWHNINESIVEQAISIYKLALGVNFIAGRTVRLVAAVCLYAACRRDSNNQMLLMDFAEGIAVNVFRVGQTWTDLKKAIYLGDLRPTLFTDPEQLIMKFAKKLEFGNAVSKVAEDASRILKRMKRDWMVTGRQPAGLCGACIILAARMNNFRRSVREVVYVVRVADMTVAKRLEEFTRTQASKLTVQQFKEHGLLLKKTSDPPAFYEKEERERKKLMKKRKREELEAGAETVSRDHDQAAEAELISTPTTKAPKTTRSTRSKKQDEMAGPNGADTKEVANGQGSIPATGGTITDTSSATLRKDKSKAKAGPSRKNKRKHATEEESINEVNEPGDQLPATPRRKSAKTSKNGRVDKDGFAIPDPPIDPNIVDNAEDASAPSPGIANAKKATPSQQPLLTLTPEDLIGEEELEREMESILGDHQVPTILPPIEFEDDGEEDEDTKMQRENAKSLADSIRSQESGGAPPVSNEEIIDEDEFADDSEVEGMILSPEEQKVKERIWLHENEDWMRARQAKMLKKALDEATGNTKKPRQPRKRTRMGDGSVLQGGTPVESAADATQRMLEKRAKNPSKHISYEKLQSLYASFGRPGSSSGSRAGSTTARAAGSRASSVAAAGASEELQHAPSASIAQTGVPTPAATQAKPSEAMQTRGKDAKLQEKEAEVEEDEEAADEIDDDWNDEEDDEDLDEQERDTMRSFRKYGYLGPDTFDEDEEVGFDSADDE